MYTNTAYHLNIYPKGRPFFVGDLHGCLAEFHAALAAVDFSPENGDIVVSVGDLVDRGNACVEVLQLLSQPWFHAVMGNHEKMLYDTLIRRNVGQCCKWMANGAKWYLHLDKPRKIIVKKLAKAYIASAPYAITVNLPSGKKIGVVHGEVPDNSWSAFLQGLAGERYRHRVLWGRKRAHKTLLAMQQGDDQSLPAIEGISSVVFGHTPMRKGPVVSRNMIWIDTGAVYGGALTLMESAQVLEHTGKDFLYHQLTVTNKEHA